MNPFRNRSLLVRSVRACILASLGAVLACSSYHERVTPVRLPGPGSPHVDVQGALVAADAYVDSAIAKQAFGFDIRGAGLLPVRLAIDNRSRNVIQVDPRQTFLIDRRGMAWPLLTGEQAYRRVLEATSLAERTGNAGPSALLGAATGTLTGFAIGFLLHGGFAGGAQGALLEHAAGGAVVGAITGGSRDTAPLEERIRRDLASQSLRNQRLQAGALAQGYLFFPGKDEAVSADSLRLGLELDGYPQVVNVPLVPAAAVRR